MIDGLDDEARGELQDAVQRLKQLNQQILELAANKEELEDELTELKQARSLLDDADDDATMLKRVGGGVTVETSRIDAEDDIDDRIETLEERIERHQKSINAFKDEFEQHRADLESRVEGVDE